MPVRLGRVHDPAVRGDLRGSVRGLRDRLDVQRIAVRVAVVRQDVDRDRLVLVRRRRVGHRQGPIVHRGDSNLDIRLCRATVAVRHRVGEPVGAVPVRFRLVHDPAVLRDPRGSVFGLGDRLDVQRVAIHIAIVRQHFYRNRLVFVRCRRVAHRNGRVVHRGDSNVNPCLRCLTDSVGGGVGEPVGAVPVCLRRVHDPAARCDPHGSVCGLGYGREAHRVAVHVPVVRQHIDGDRLVLVRHCRVTHRQGPVVHRDHSNLDIRLLRPTIAVGHRVSEPVVAVPVRLRHVHDPAVRHDPRDSVRGLGDRLDVQRIAIQVGVVRQHIDRDRVVLVRDGRVAPGHGHVVHGGDSNLNLRSAGCAVAVGHRVSEPVGAVPVRRRCVHDPAVRGDPHGPVRGLRDRLDVQRVTVHVPIVRQHLDRDRVVLDSHRRVAAGHGRVVHRGDPNLDLRLRRGTVAVGHRVSEPVGAVPVRFRPVHDPAARRDPRGSVRGLGDRLNVQRVAIHIAVVRQHVDRDGLVLVRRRRVWLCHRSLVHVHHPDRYPDRSLRSVRVSRQHGQLVPVRLRLVVFARSHVFHRPVTQPDLEPRLVAGRQKATHLISVRVRRQRRAKCYRQDAAVLVLGENELIQWLSEDRRSVVPDCNLDRTRGPRPH